MIQDSGWKYLQHQPLTSSWGTSFDCCLVNRRRHQLLETLGKVLKAASSGDCVVLWGTLTFT